MCQDQSISRQWENPMASVSVIGLDLAKNVFQVHGWDWD